MRMNGEEGVECHGWCEREIGGWKSRGGEVGYHRDGDFENIWLGYGHGHIHSHGVASSVVWSLRRCADDRLTVIVFSRVRGEVVLELESAEVSLDQVFCYYPLLL